MSNALYASHEPRQPHRRPWWLLFAVLTGSVLSQWAAAAPSTNEAAEADAFFRVPLAQLKPVEGAIPEAAPFSRTSDVFSRAFEPWVRVDGAGGEGHVEFHDGYWNAYLWSNVPNGQAGAAALVVCAPAGRDVTGVLYVPAADWAKMVGVKFRLAAADADPAARTAFYKARLIHYETLLEREAPGAAWFRHQARDARLALGEAAAGQLQRPTEWRVSSDGLDDTYNLFTGGRALSENLQLDRVIPATGRREEMSIPIEKVEGITVKEMDWTPFLRDKHPALDPLAREIPADQHAIFFPSFQSAMDVIDEADAQGVPVLQALEPRAEDAMTKERYQKQLCLSLTGVGRLVGPRVINSVAVTGSDPYLRTGSDVAILFEAKDPEALQSLLAAQLTLGRQRSPDAKAVEGKLPNGAAFTGARSPDRSVCAYVARLGGLNVLVVTNSLAQLDRLVAAHEGNAKALASAAEYTFFRDRYPRGDADESAFVVLTDATIRRWCGPRWRIADSRRTQAAAVLAELQAKHFAELADRNTLSPVPTALRPEPAPLKSDRDVPELGDLRLTRAGVESSTYGTLGYLTPIIELPTSKVTAGEASFYNRWRDGYQQNWSNYFDPIAIRLSVKGGALAADMTVMPLIASSEYKTFLDLAKGVHIAPGSGDLHGDALLQAALAINKDSEPVKEASGFAIQVAPNLKQAKIEPLGWLGKTIAVYVDDDPVWSEAAKAGDVEKFFEDNAHRLPVALYVESGSPLKLAAFMTAVHAFVDQTVPAMSKWEPQEYHDQAYVRVSAKGTGLDEVDRTKLYYAVTPEALVLTPNEDVIKRALDRQAARRLEKAAAAAPGAVPAKASGDAPAAPVVAVVQPATTQPAPRPWLGESLSLQADARGLMMLESAYGPTYRRRMQELAWASLPILNEWKRLYPAQDPVALHARLWHTRLTDPAGGQYVWNDQYQTMESTTYGHPADPKAGPTLPPQLQGLKHADFGITFEDQGLRARARVERQKN